MVAFPSTIIPSIWDKSISSPKVNKGNWKSRQELLYRQHIVTCFDELSSCRRVNFKSLAISLQTLKYKLVLVERSNFDSNSIL